MGGVFRKKSGPFLNAGCIGMYSISIFYFTFYLFGGAYAPNAQLPTALRKETEATPTVISRSQCLCTLSALTFDPDLQSLASYGQTCNNEGQKSEWKQMDGHAYLPFSLMQSVNLINFAVCDCSKTYIHTHPFNGPLSGTTQVSRYQKGKTNLDFFEARDSEWLWHQLGRMQVCTSLETDNHASTPPLMFFTGRMPFLPPNQQRQSTEMLLRALHHW